MDFLFVSASQSVRGGQNYLSSQQVGKSKGVRLPLFEVELAYVEGIEELAAASRNPTADPSELMLIYPPENEFHTRLEVRIFQERYHQVSFNTGHERLLGVSSSLNGEAFIVFLVRETGHDF